MRISFVFPVYNVVGFHHNHKKEAQKVLESGWVNFFFENTSTAIRLTQKTQDVESMLG